MKLQYVGAYENISGKLNICHCFNRGQGHYRATNVYIVTKYNLLGPIIERWYIGS